MRFLKLLDPRAATAFGPGLTIGQQQELARERFPQLVEASPFFYWKLGDAIVECEKRILIGVGASFVLPDLRLLDILIDCLVVSPRNDTRIDVFNVDDLGYWETAPIDAYFPGMKPVSATPLVGVWEFGHHRANYWGGNAMDYLLKEFQIPGSAREIAESVCPPSPELMEK